MQKSEKIKVLASVYACSPEWGSEVGTGWGWAMSLASCTQLDVITEAAFEPAITAWLAQRPNVSVPTFHYVDIGSKGRELFWKQGCWGFYGHYNQWQQKAQTLACQLHDQKQFDIIHQLGMIGFREPGYLWEIHGNHKFIWGPIGGMGIIPWSYLPLLGAKECLKYGLKNILNLIQEYFSLRVRHAVKRADLLYAATVENQMAIKNIFKKNALLLNETGSDAHLIAKSKTVNQSGELHLVWCGVMEARKALNLVLESVVLCRQKGTQIKLHIVGGGHCELQWQKLSQKLGTDENIIWYGKVSPEKVRQIMLQGDVMLLSSIREGTPHVLLEALENGLPVICHNCCGMSSVIDHTCGVLVDLKNPQHSITGFYNAVNTLYHDRNLLQTLSDGALERARQLSWQNKAQKMLEHYQKLILKTAVTAPQLSSENQRKT